MDQKIKKPVRRKIGKGALITIIILLVILLFILVSGYFYYRQTTDLITKKQNEAAELEPETTKVERGNLSNKLDDISGIVRSNQSVYLYWQTSGTVENVYVEVGDKVEKGDVIAEIFTEKKEIINEVEGMVAKAVPVCDEVPEKPKLIKYTIS